MQYDGYGSATHEIFIRNFPTLSEKLIRGRPRVVAGIITEDCASF